MKAMKLTFAASLLGLAVQAGTVVWVPGQTSLGDGAVTVEYSGELVKKMTVNPGGDKLTLTGTDAVAFAADANLYLTAGAVRFETPVTGAGNLYVEATNGAFTWDAVVSGRNDYLPENEADAVVVAQGVNLDDIELDHAACGTKNLGYYYGSGDGNVLPYFIQRGAGTWSCQLQHVSDVWNKCIWLNLKQVGDTIVAWTPRTRYAHYQTTPAPVGTDFEKIKSNAQTISSVAKKQSGYGVDALTFVRVRNAARIEVANGLSLGATLIVRSGTLVVADGANALTTAMNWNVPLSLSGTFRVVDPNGLRLGGSVNYGRLGRIEVVAETPAPCEAFVLNAPDWPGGSWETIATNVFLTSVTNVTAMTGGSGWFDSGTSRSLVSCLFENDGKLLTSQHQYYDDGTYVKGCVYQLRQVGAYVQARILRSAYKSGATKADEGKTDLRKETNMDIYNGGKNGKENGYGLKTIKIYFSDAPVARTIELAGAVVRANLGWGTMTFEGSSTARLYATGVVGNAIAENTEVNAWATLDWAVSGWEVGTPKSTMRIREHGEYLDHYGWTWNPQHQLVMEGGDFRVGAFSAASGETAQSIYLNTVTFSAGGHIADHTPRVGYYTDPVWKVTGTEPAFVDYGLGAVGNGQDNVLRTLTFDVADVTASDDADMTIGGKIYYSNDAWKKIQVVKIGAGTLRHNGNFLLNQYPLILRGGTWQVTRSNGLVAGLPVQFEGGALGIDANCSQSLGTITLAASTASAVRLGAGSSLTASGLTAADGATLDFVRPNKETVRFGTSKCLSRAQLRCLRINGGRVHQDAAGYLHEGAPGGIVTVR